MQQGPKPRRPAAGDRWSSTPDTVNARYGLKERGQTLDVARRLEMPLEADGHALCMTRTGDKTLSNNDRYANTTGAEVLVSAVLLNSDMPATIAETVFTASDAEGRLLSDGTGAPAADSGGFENRDPGLPVHPLTGRFPVAPASPNPARPRPSKM